MRDDKQIPNYLPNSYKNAFEYQKLPPLMIKQLVAPILTFLRFSRFTQNSQGQLVKSPAD